MVLCNNTCEMSLPYLTCSLRTVLLLYNQSVVMLLFFFTNSVGPQISKEASKAKNHTYQSTTTVRDFEVLSRRTKDR